MDDPLFPLLLILRYMHILGAIMLMGATIFMRFALAPTVARLEGTTRAELHEQIRSRWSTFVMLASALLLISGIMNLGLARWYEREPVFGMSYDMVAGIKFLLSLPIFLFAGFLVGRSATAKRFQANAVTWMNVNLVLALIMVLIGGVLRFVPLKSQTGQPENAAVTARLEPPREMLPLDAAPK
jgi:hypothetical protein